MISSHIRAIALAAACVTGISATPSAIAAPFDGDWRVLVQTNDHCGTSQWGLVIIDGRVYHRGMVFVGGYPAGVGGRVGPAGRITVKVVAGPRFATGTGRLGKRQGSGKWAGRGPSGTCAGIWTATRLNERAVFAGW